MINCENLILTRNAVEVVALNKIHSELLIHVF